MKLLNYLEKSNKFILTDGNLDSSTCSNSVYFYEANVIVDLAQRSAFTLYRDLASKERKAVKLDLLPIEHSRITLRVLTLIEDAASRMYKHNILISNIRNQQIDDMLNTNNVSIKSSLVKYTYNNERYSSVSSLYVSTNDQLFMAYLLMRLKKNGGESPHHDDDDILF